MRGQKTTQPGVGGGCSSGADFTEVYDLGLTEYLDTLSFVDGGWGCFHNYIVSFGIGGREAAGKQMEHWLKQLRGDKGK